MLTLRALGLVVGLLAVLVWLVPAAPLTGDGAGYVEFVRNNLQHGASSWHERRLLGPAIVRVLPLEPVQGFLVLTLVSLTVIALLTWRAARDLIPSDTRALLAIPLLFGTWVAAPNVREYALVDPLAWAFVAGVWLATLRRQWLLAAILCAIGVLAKEIVALSALAAAAAAWDRRTPWRPIAVAAPALVGVGLLTMLFPGSGTDAAAYVVKWVRDGLGSLGAVRTIYLVFASYGALWLLMPSGWRALPPHLKRAGGVYLLAGLVLPLLGSPERMEEAIFPIVVSCAMLATRHWQPALAWALAIGNLLFVARVGGDAHLPTVLAWGGLGVAVLLVVWSLVRPRLALRPAILAGLDDR